jgi:hypothetical protein
MAEAWEEIGREIRERRLKEALALKEKIDEEVKAFPPEEEFVAAVICHAVGYPSLQQYIIDYLRSDRPLSSRGREALARFFEGNLKRRGHPTNWRAHEAAKLAKEIYQEWKAKNSCEGVSTRGLGESMKLKASGYAVEIVSWPASDEHLVETVRELMDRSKRRLDRSQHRHK